MNSDNIIPNFARLRKAKFAPKGLRDKIRRGFCRFRKVILDFSRTILCMRFSASTIWDTLQNRPNSRRVWSCSPSLSLGADFSSPACGWQEKSGIIFELNNAHFSYLGKFPALCGIDLKIERGQRICVLGANGCGKSTLLQMLDGLIFPDIGAIKAFGRPLSEKAFEDEKFIKFFRKSVGFVFQNSDVQLFCPTVKEDIVFGPLELGVEKKEIENRLRWLIEALNLDGLLDRPPYQLSVGEKKRVAIASTLISEPDVLILDEPTAGLDPLTSRHIIDIIYHAAESGKTIITTTQDLHIVPEIADTIYIFDSRKRIAASGKCEDILANQDLLTQHNLVHIHKHKHNTTWHKHLHEHGHIHEPKDENLLT